MFFAAFLPQFMDLGRSAAAQGVALGAMFVALAAITDTTYALAASSVAPALARTERPRASGRYLD